MHTLFNLKKEPFVLLLLATVILLFALALRPIAHLDYEDKVMFGVPLDNMVWFIPFYLLTCWFIYLATKKSLYSTTMTWVHVMTTITPVFFIGILVYASISPSTDTKDMDELIGNAMQLMTIIFLWGQLLFLINIGLGMVKKTLSK